jgi:D-galactarolactone cycloisomerase
VGSVREGDRQPIGRLLGGRYRESVLPYASLLMCEPSEMRDVLSETRQHGFRAFKIGWGPFGRKSAAPDEPIVRAARDAVGEDSFLMVDAGASDAFWPQDYKWALRTADMLAEYQVTWFEEPLKPDAIEDYVALRRGAFDIVQPDATKVGGLSEMRRIA